MTRPEELRTAALMAARIHGCKCDPEIDVEEEQPGLYHSHVYHDHWCPLLRAVQAEDN